MSPIRNTVLFKSLLALSPDEADQIELDLANVAAYTRVDWKNPDPSDAFTWANTPHGSDYWTDIAMQYMERDIRD